MAYMNWKKDSSNWEIDPEAEEKNKILKNRKRTRWYKKLFYWFFSAKDKLLKELFCNWLIVISAITIVVLALTGSDALEDGTATAQSVGAGFFAVMIMLLIFIGSGIYKVILKYRKKKGLYWPKYKKIDKQNFKGGRNVK